jgi:NhaP-type Na+/H+ or K+/H+ antiporter
MWFAGLRGAISFALSLNMPGEHKDLYVTTTLSLVIITTIGLGGFTERVLSKMGMKVQPKTIAARSTSPMPTGHHEVGIWYD